MLINWVNIIYNDISSCIYNNGETSKYFKLHRGVRQGDPLSPYLFIIAVDILARIMIQDNNIKGFQINSHNIKVTQYADDLTLMLSDMNSINEALSLLKTFGEYSGLRVNTDKTIGMLLGAWKNRQDLPHNINWTNKPIKLLGIYISNNTNEAVMENFNSKVEALLRQLHWWKARDLSLRGKVLIIKALALSKFQYLASLVTIPDHVIKQVNSIIYDFIWNGKTDKVKRNLFEQEFKNGGYKMINFTDIITASSVMSVQKYLDYTEREWKHTLEWFSNKKNLKLFLTSNFDVEELPTRLPSYYINAI